MDKFEIEGGIPLKGSVPIAGAKNAALPILAATLLCEGESVIEGVPDLRDIRTMIELLRELGCEVERSGDDLRIEVTDTAPFEAPYRIVKQMRASFSVLGPLLARRGRGTVSMPGGCNLGLRPVDLHLKGLRALGAKIEIDGGYVQGEGCPRPVSPRAPRSSRAPPASRKSPTWRTFWSPVGRASKASAARAWSSRGSIACKASAGASSRTAWRRAP
jgi:5-enolpyruvylshikimate-3-phosphate synthase